MRSSAINDRFIFMADYSEFEEMLDPTWLKEDRQHSQDSQEEQIQNELESAGVDEIDDAQGDDDVADETGSI